MGTTDVFSVPIFLIILRETIEAGIIVSILLSFIKQLMAGRAAVSLPVADTVEAEARPEPVVPAVTPNEDGTIPTVLPGVDASAAAADVLGASHLTEKQLYRKLVWQVWLGTIIGFGIALSIGAAFIAVFYTKLKDLWASTEEIWEGAFSLLAAGIILAMGVAFLKLEGSSAKWRVVLAHAFEHKGARKGGRTARYALMTLPLITVLREGLEAIIFVGGVSLTETPASIPLAVVVGLLCGALISYFIYKGGAVMAIRYFLVGSTCVLFLIGAGLFSKAIGYFQVYVFETGVGADVGELGDGPGSFNVIGNVWHLTYGNPENTQTGGGWSIFNAILGWNNTATIGSIVSYCAYWIAVVAILTYLKWKEGRCKLFWFLKSEAYKKRHVREAERKAEAAALESESVTDEKASLESPA